MQRILTIMCALALSAAPVTWASDAIVTKKSPHSVAKTLDRLESVLKEKGIKVVARVRHSAAAKDAGLTLRPTELLIFGNPKLGTPLMQSSQQAGLDLPMKVLAYEDAKGQVWIAYAAPSAIAKRHGIADRGEVVQKMNGALGKMTDQAVVR